MYAHTWIDVRCANSLSQKSNLSLISKVYGRVSGEEKQDLQLQNPAQKSHSKLANGRNVERICKVHIVENGTKLKNGGWGLQHFKMPSETWDKLTPVFN